MARVPFGCIDNQPILHNAAVHYDEYSFKLDKRFSWRIDRAVKTLMDRYRPYGGDGSANGSDAAWGAYFRKQSDTELARWKAYHFFKGNPLPALKHLANLSDSDLSLVRGVGAKTIEYIRLLVWRC